MPGDKTINVGHLHFNICLTGLRKENNNDSFLFVSPFRSLVCCPFCLIKKARDMDPWLFVDLFGGLISSMFSRARESQGSGSPAVYSSL